MSQYFRNGKARKFNQPVALNIRYCYCLQIGAYTVVTHLVDENNSESTNMKMFGKKLFPLLDRTRAELYNQSQIRSQSTTVKLGYNEQLGTGHFCS